MQQLMCTDVLVWCRFVYLVIYFIFQETSLWSMSAVFSQMAASIVSPLLVRLWHRCLQGHLWENQKQLKQKISKNFRDAVVFGV